MIMVDAIEKIREFTNKFRNFMYTGKIYTPMHAKTINVESAFEKFRQTLLQETDKIAWLTKSSDAVMMKRGYSNHRLYHEPKNS
jgi:hypothetical protein